MHPSLFSNPVFAPSVVAPDGATRFAVQDAPAGMRARFGTCGGGFAYMAGLSVVVAPARPMTKTIACTATGTPQIAPA